MTLEADPADEAAIRALYQQIIDGWNARDAGAMTAPFADDAELIGFDGYTHVGRAQAAEEMRRIFTDHVTAPYVSRVQGVRMLTPEAAILRAIVGMVPPGQTDIAPQVNALQTLVVVKRDGQWSAVLFQNTPAQFHGRPDLVEQMTDELRQLL